MSTATLPELVRYDAMCRAITACNKVDKVKDIRDKAVALEAYAKQAQDTENERRACEIRLRAERKCGQLLSKTVKRGKQPKGNALSPLKSVGVSKKQSSDWQKLAAVPEKQFEAALGDRTQKPTTNGIITAAAAPKQKPVSSEALWLWGRLRDFERDGLLNRDPADVMSTMTDGMRDDVHTLAPRVSAWLRRIGAI